MELEQRLGGQCFYKNGDNLLRPFRGRMMKINLVRDVLMFPLEDNMSHLSSVVPDTPLMTILQCQREYDIHPPHPLADPLFLLPLHPTKSVHVTI